MNREVEKRMLWPEYLSFWKEEDYLEMSRWKQSWRGESSGFTKILKC
jgi:hypothetical protein